QLHRVPRLLPSFPTRRSSDLRRALVILRTRSYNPCVTEFRILGTLEVVADDGEHLTVVGQKQRAVLALLVLRANEVVSKEFLVEDRKSTRLNSSHLGISYAVF